MAATSFESKKPVPNKEIISAYSPKAEALVNKHLYNTSLSQEFAEKRRQAENVYMAPQIGDAIWPKKSLETKNYGVDHSSDTRETNAFNDLNRYRKDIHATDPDYIIQNQINDEDRISEYQELSKQEYVRQFVENARRNGFEVNVNQDFVITSVRPIRQPTGKSLFPNSQRDPSMSGAEWAYRCSQRVSKTVRPQSYDNRVPLRSNDRSSEFESALKS